LTAASSNPNASSREILLTLFNDQTLPAATRIAIAKKSSRARRSQATDDHAERSKQRPGDSKPAGEGKETSPLRTAATATLSTLDLLLCIAQDATAPLAERRKAASEAARFFLPKKPGPKKSRRGKFPPDACGFSIDPNSARELRDAKLQLACLRLSRKKLTPDAVARKGGKIHARIKEIQDALQCPCPSKYRLTYVVDGATVPGEIVRDSERLTVLSKRRMEKKTFTAEEDLEEAIRMARLDSFLVGPEVAAGERVTKLREKKRVARGGNGPPLSRAEEASLRCLGLLYPPARPTLNEEEIRERYPLLVRLAEAECPPDHGAVSADELNELDGDGGAEGEVVWFGGNKKVKEDPPDVDFVPWLKGQSRYRAGLVRDAAMRRFHRRYPSLVPDLVIDLMRHYDDLVDNAQGPSIMPDEDLSEQFKVVLKRNDDSLKNPLEEGI
jgi:hypothetical protein